MTKNIFTKGRISVATPHLYSPGGSIGLTVRQQFKFACFGWRFNRKISPSSGV